MEVIIILRLKCRLRLHVRWTYFDLDVLIVEVKECVVAFDTMGEVVNEDTGLRETR